MVVRILLSDSIHLIPVTLNDFFSWPGDRNSTSVTLGKKKKKQFPEFDGTFVPGVMKYMVPLADRS